MISLHYFTIPSHLLSLALVVFRNFFLLAKFILLHRYDDKFYGYIYIVYSVAMQGFDRVLHNYDASSMIHQRDFQYLSIWPT